MIGIQLITTGNPFVFSEKNLEEINTIKFNYPPERSASAVMSVLWLAQKQHHNWISKEIVETVAVTLNLPIMRIYEIVTFYSMYNLEPVGEFHIQVCRTTPCWLRGSNDILKACLSACDLTTTKQLSSDQKFFISEVECLGACANAPMIQINNSYYEDLTPESVKDLLLKLKLGELKLKESADHIPVSDPNKKTQTIKEVDQILLI